MQYRIEGDPMPVVICDLEEGETIVSDKGAMAWMSPNMQMETTAGGTRKAFGRMLSGETIFQNRYTAVGGPGLIAFGSSFLGSIHAVEIRPESNIIIQKSAFLASEQEVESSIFFRKKFAQGFFGGEGFIMQKLSGKGIAFLEIDGSVVEYNLSEGESMLIDTGYLAMMDETCTFDIERVQGAKNVVFGGEGFYNTKLTGPGRILLQTMPVSNFARMVYERMPHS